VLAHSRADEYDCGISLHPKQVGNAWFTRESSLGFYLHKRPFDPGSGFAKKIQNRRRSPR
jgi:hypothetical protein